MSRKKLKLTSRTTRPKKNRSASSRQTSDKAELVFVVDITSFTKAGYECSSSYEGTRINIECDTADQGLVLSKSMCERAGMNRGSLATISVEGEQKIEVFESVVTKVNEALRFSNAKLYYLIGSLGGAIVRIRKA